MSLKLLLFFIVLLNIIPFVNSQYFYDQSFSGFGFFPFSFSFSGLIDFYLQNSTLIDFFIALGLLISLFQALLEEKMGKQTPLFLGLMLAIGFAYIETTWEFHLGYFGPVALLIFFLLMAHTIHKQHEGRPIAVKLAGLALLAFLLYMFWPSIANYLPGVSGSGASKLGLLIALAVIGIILFYLLTRKPQHDQHIKDWEKNEGAGTGRGGGGWSLPSFFKRTQEDADFNRLSLLVSDFLKNSQDLNQSRDFLLRRYDATRSELDSFLARYQNSKYKGKVNELGVQIIKSFENFSNIKKIIDQTQQVVNHLETLLSNIQDESIENIVSARAEAVAFYSKYESQIKLSEALNARLNIQIGRLNEKINKFQRSKKNTMQISPEAINKYREISPDSVQQVRLEEAYEGNYQEESLKFSPVEKRVRGFFSSCEDFLSRRMSKEDFSSLHQQTQAMLSNYISKAQPSIFLDKAQQYRLDVENAYNTTVNEYINAQNKRETTKTEPHEITKELDEAERRLNYALANFDSLQAEELISISKHVDNAVETAGYTEDYNPLLDQINLLKARIAKRKRTSIKATNKEDRDRILYELRTRLIRAVQNSENISVENLKSTLTWAQETYEDYFDSNTGNYSEESKLLKQLRNVLMQKQRAVPVNKETAARELYELRSRISRALENTNLNRAQLTELLTWAKQIHEKYYSYGFMGSEELDLIEKLEKKLAQQGTEVVGIFENVKLLWQNNAEFNSLNKEAKKLSNSISVSGKENAANINNAYNDLIAKLNKFSTTSKGTFNKKIEKLRSQLINEVYLFRQKNSLQVLINELTAFVNSIGRGDIPLIQAKRTYAEARRKYSGFESSNNRDLLKQGLDLAYHLLKVIFSYVTKFSSINLVEHEISRIREQINAHTISQAEIKREREKMITQLEDIVLDRNEPGYILLNTKKSSLLGELRSGY